MFLLCRAVIFKKIMNKVRPKSEESTSSKLHTAKTVVLNCCQFHTIRGQVYCLDNIEGVKLSPKCAPSVDL